MVMTREVGARLHLAPSSRRLELIVGTRHSLAPTLSKTETMEDNLESPIWHLVLIELSLRALRKLHIDYGVWGLGQKEESAEKFHRINNGPGIELALETHVGAAITHEFINSAFTNGFKYKRDVKRWEIRREVVFSMKDDSDIEPGSKRHVIDLSVNRFDYDKGTITYWKPGLVELKRAYHFAPDIEKGQRGPRRRNFPAVIKDLQRLQNINSLYSKGLLNCSLPYPIKDNRFFLRSLFWGLSDGVNHKPDEVLAAIRKQGIRLNTKTSETRWHPLSWNQNIRKPLVKEWLWVCLVEPED